GGGGGRGGRGNLRHRGLSGCRTWATLGRRLAGRPDKFAQP
ncbi:MAG: hypothetical protein JWL68_1260, partial [Actinomycetia bacterium]|nr:hypothetical protein [Actinomycetes bacterium]